MALPLRLHARHLFPQDGDLPCGVYFGEQAIAGRWYAYAVAPNRRVIAMRFFRTIADELTAMRELHELVAYLRREQSAPPAPRPRRRRRRHLRLLA